MAKRIAYVGLSSPLFYDYSNPADKCYSDMSSSPNPILQNSMGLQLLFDEIWFLSRSLCPQNMRELSFVKFIEDREDFPVHLNPDLDRTDEAEYVVRRLNAEITLPKIIDKEYDLASRYFFDNYKQFLAETGWNFGNGGPDNHTHGLKIHDIKMSANSASFTPLLYDLLVIDHYSESSLELHLNHNTQSWLLVESLRNRQVNLAEETVRLKIPGYLSKNGPGHPCILYARDNKYLVDFRKWCTEVSNTIPLHQTKQLATEVNHELAVLQNKVFLKEFNPAEYIKRVGWSLFDTGIDLATTIPSAYLRTIFGNLVSFSGLRKRRWQAFLTHNHLNYLNQRKNTRE